MTHLALDLALTRTGLCWGPGEHDSEHAGPPAKLRNGERLHWWRRYVLDVANRLLPDAFVVEAPFVHSKHVQGAIELFKLHGVVEQFAYAHAIAYVTVEPKTLKKWATGNGNADKSDMVHAAQSRSGFRGKDHNEADAVLLWHWREATVLA